MGDTILFGVLRMPPELWGDDDIDRQQRYARYVEAADKIDFMQDQIIDLSKAIDALKKDKARLDFLDECNRRLNEYCGTKYGWKLIQSHLVNRLMFKDLGLHSGGVDLNDAEANGFDSCRKAIDEKMKS